LYSSLSATLIHDIISWPPAQTCSPIAHLNTIRADLAQCQLPHMLRPAV